MPRYQQQRWSRQCVQQRRVRDAALALNVLSAARVRPGGCRVKPFAGPPSAVQRDCLDRIGRAVARYEAEEPKDLRPEEALKELLKSKSLYGEEPHHLAEYDFAKLRVVRGDVVPKDATTVLLPVASGFLRHFDSQIEKNTEQIEQLCREEKVPTPYWDPKLKRDKKARLHLLKSLFDLGLCSVRRAVKARVGLFFVKKKDGMIRLICDSRVVNMMHRRPPKTRLGGPDALTEIDLSDEVLEKFGGFGEIANIEICGGTSDVKDSFFQYKVKEVASWFGLGDRIRAADWDIREVWCDKEQRYVETEPGENLEIVMEAMSMGWTWARYFCNEGTTSCVAESNIGSLVRDKAPAPYLSRGMPLSAVYVDNLTTIGGCPKDTADGLSGFEEVAARKQLSLHPPERSTRIETLGLVFDGRDRSLLHRHERLWRFRAATKALMQRSWTRRGDLEVWLGHAINMMRLCRPLMSRSYEGSAISGSESRGSLGKS